MSGSKLQEVESVANEVLPVVGAAVGAFVPAAAPFIPEVEAGVVAAEGVAPDVVAQVQSLTTAHAATADKVTAATGLLADLVAFLSHLFPGHSVPGTK
jgi:hypothetical protein